MYANFIVDKKHLPEKMVTFSHLKSEAGRGQQSHDFYRLNQFSKVEMLGLTEGHSTECEKLLFEIVDIQEEIIQSLGLPYRT